MKTPQLDKLRDVLFSVIDQMTKEELKDLHKECAYVTRTNCGWQAYGVSEIVRYHVSVKLGEKRGQGNE